MTSTEINNILDLREYLISIFRTLASVSIILGGSVDENSANNCSAVEAEKIACEEFYEGTILEDESAGFIKLNISKEEVLNELYKIYAEEF